ncbi:MAG: hypothetical protein KDA79_19035, partial [Planctomycetaceae bacterium]|nr:hypothetical protein [Planctomycetaceae bacterium]
MNRFQFRSTLQAFGLTSRWPGRAAAARPVRGARSAVKAGLPADRRGSTLVIVISLLGMLTLLGLLTYTITSQEEISAEYFSDASKSPDSFTDADLLFDHALRQLILGADQPERHSALHGGRASLMASMFGRDLQPYNGKGITLGWNSTSDRPFVDQDLDGASDNAHLLDLNLSPAAQDGIPDLNDATVGFPDPDVDYTYPDINSPWLGLRAEIPTSSSSTIPVIIPSFHRPQYLRNNGVAANEWYTDSGTRDKVFRAHKQHMAVTDNGTVTTTSRYFLTLADATAQGLSGPFPFPDSVDNPSYTNEGVWNGGSSNASNVRYDADADGDGFFEAVWMDLDFPAQSNAAGELYVPMFAMSVYDADALLNLNVHGNLAGDTRLNNNPFGGNRYGVGADGAPGTVNVDDDGNGIIDDEAEMGWGGSDDTIYSQPPSISRSNLGVNPSEVNPQWGLTATHSVSDPTNTLLQHRLFFGHDPASVQELSNMEWFFLTTGRPDFSPGASSTPAGSGDIVAVISGRYGESTRITNGVSTRNAASFPLPGKSFPLATFIPAQHLVYDDNLNYNEGGTYSGDNLLFPTGLSFLAWEHPLDLHGSGRLVSSGSYGLRRLMYSTGQHKYPSYYNYIVAPGVRYRNYGTHLMQNESALYQVDDVEEMFHEPSLAADQADDSIFGTEEMAGLHLTDSDRIA